MKVETIELKSGHKNGLYTSAMDGICHVKTLPYLSVVQATEGSYSIQLNNDITYNTGDGGFFIAPSNIQQTITHHNSRHSNLINCRWVFLETEINHKYAFDEIYDFPVLLPEDYKKQMNEVFDRLFKTDNVFEEYSCYYEIIHILSSVSDIKSERLPSNVLEAVFYIKDHYQEQITVADLAALSHMSVSNFYVAFKKVAKCSPIAYLNNFRLSLAAEALSNTDLKVHLISESVGIKDSVYFNKLFKKTYHISPSEYRNIYKQGLPIPPV